MSIQDLDKCMYPGIAEKLVENGLLAGKVKNGKRYLEPGAKVTREEVWLFIDRALKMKDFANMLPELYNQYVKGIVKIVSKDGATGSGVFIDKDIIITNHHVVEGTKEVDIYLHGRPDNQPSVRACKVIKTNETKDLALVQLSKELSNPAKIIEIAAPGEIDEAMNCMVLGNPLGQPFTITAGIITFYGNGYIQTDALVNPGNSGGGLLLESGRLVGIPTKKIIPKGTDNFNVCIPVEVIREFLVQ